MSDLCAHSTPDTLLLAYNIYNKNTVAADAAGAAAARAGIIDGIKTYTKPTGRAACFHRGRIKGRIMFHKRSRNFLVSVFTRIALLHYINGNIIVIIGIMLSCAAHNGRMEEPIGGDGG